MERMLTVIFGDESKAYEGTRALKELDSDGSISIHAQAVITKLPNGAISVKQTGDEFPIRTLSGTAIGSLIGLLGGPIGFAVGVGAGTLAGALADVHRSGLDEGFLGEVSARLTPGKWAIVSDISEESTIPVDGRMKVLGGRVYRTDRKNFEAEQRAREVAGIRIEITQLKTKQAQKRVHQKHKLQTKIRLRPKAHAKLPKTRLQRTTKKKPKSKSKP